MAINDISLTAGMRSNLLSLQNTVNLLNRTQDRLSSGKKVNSAIDNPVSFFTAQSLTSRAGIIDGLKDAMGQAVSTIKAADKGITAINSMIEQAKGIAQSALSADNTQDTVDVTLASVVAGDTFAMGGVTLTATAAGVTAGAGEFNVGATEAETAANLAEAVNAATYGGDYFTATVDGAVVSFTQMDSVTDREIDAAVADITITGGGATGALVDADESELESLVTQYNTLLTQLSELAEDSGYKGKNLLSATETMRELVVQFEGTTLTVDGFDSTATGLGLNSVDWSSEAATQIDTDLTALDSALGTLRSESSKMSSNLSIITTRQDFSTNMINTLTEGSDKLTLADTNEEGANMLMLQTRQSLSTTALSMSAQAAQAVLRLFG